MDKTDITLAGFVAVPTPRITKAPDHKIVYTNAIRSGLGPWDIRLIFGQVIETADQSQVLEDIVTVIMSPEHAKAVLKLLDSVVQGYESTFGEIKDLTPIIEKAKADLAAGQSKN